jgi:hypothetical protein
MPTADRLPPSLEIPGCANGPILAMRPNPIARWTLYLLIWPHFDGEILIAGRGLR